MSSDIAVSIKNVKKDFHLPHDKEDSLKLKVLNLFKKNRDRGHDVYHALKGVDIEIKKGEFVGILGRNGAGKSTLLKIIAEIYQPTSGSVKVNGKLVPFIELGVGFNPNLTGRDNVFLNGAMLGFSRKEIEKMYDSIVEFAELEEFMDQKLKNYSSGQRVRLAFSMAIRADADILLLDEVLAVGDAAFQKKCYQYFDSLKENKKTIILVSHSMGVIRQYCDRAILIEDGKASFEGAADQVADEYLKLFNKSHTKKISKNDRWGNQDVVIESVDVSSKKDEVLIDVMLASSKNNVDDVVLGIKIRGSDGKVLAGANTINTQGGRPMNFRSNEKKRVSFHMSDIFGNQTYDIDATVRLGDGVTFCDNWQKAASFNKVKDEVYYPLVLPAEVFISDDHHSK